MEDNQDVNKDVVDEKEEVKDERPEINYQAELERRKANEAALRAENERLRAERETPKRDQSDIRTWSDQELKMLMKSNDASVAAYKEQAEDLLLDRKVERLHKQKEESRKRSEAESRLMTEFPDASDPSSAFGQKMAEVMKDLDLDRTPAGRLAAAKIASAELKLGTSKTSANKSKKDQDRLADVKGQMVDGDRPKPTDTKNPNKESDLKKRISSEKDTNSDAIGEWADSRGLREKFGKMWGR